MVVKPPKTILGGSHIGFKREEPFAVYVNQSVYHFGCAKDEGIEFEEKISLQQGKVDDNTYLCDSRKNASSMVKALNQAKR